MWIRWWITKRFFCSSLWTHCTYPRGLNDQRGSEFIDGVALEEYADEQDDYAQEREIEACIKAVDVDCDGKIGKSVHLRRGVARAERKGSSPVAQNPKVCISSCTCILGTGGCELP